jgi:beta-barrel assembly-enhancing protease
LVRAKLRATLDSTKDAMRYFEGVRQEKPDDATTAYGIASTLRRSRDYARAEQELERIRGKQGTRAMVENLAAQLKRDQKQTPQALEIYRNALKRFPDSRALAYGYAETLLDANQAQQALTFLNDRLLLTSSDPQLYELQAQSYAVLGKRLLEHRSQAEAYVRKGNLSAAIDQLQIAVRSADGDFYQQSSAEARLRELRAQHEAQKKRGGRASSN